MLTPKLLVFYESHRKYPAIDIKILHPCDYGGGQQSDRKKAPADDD